MTKKFSLEELATIDNLFMSHIERLRRERVPESLLAERQNLRNKVMEALDAEEA